MDDPILLAWIQVAVLEAKNKAYKGKPGRKCRYLALFVEHIGKSYQNFVQVNEKVDGEDMDAPGTWHKHVC